MFQTELSAAANLSLTSPAHPQAFPSYLQQYDMSHRAIDPLQGQPSFVSSMDTGAGAAAPQQSGFDSQVPTGG